ncbi:hypothetical protein [Bradyrhizobium jicamae]|uniref:hypothetical protein n=1 Tax=Bradyrhizobium jicamae TaxID=280332 RepID=UPI001BA675C2|nr:hypothetical protein [Bradyrhizobium jicamae]MBR0936676.1 hypothetical protein [Bradyrhizobium jicamae]
MLDHDDIAHALFGIQQMTLVVMGATDHLGRSEVEPEYFNMPAADAEMICFAISDVLRRVEELKDNLRAKPPVVIRLCEPPS